MCASARRNDWSEDEETRKEGLKMTESTERQVCGCDSMSICTACRDTRAVPCKGIPDRRRCNRFCNAPGEIAKYGHCILCETIAEAERKFRQVSLEMQAIPLLADLPLPGYVSHIDAVRLLSNYEEVCRLAFRDDSIALQRDELLEALKGMLVLVRLDTISCPWSDGLPLFQQHKEVLLAADKLVEKIALDKGEAGSPAQHRERHGHGSHLRPKEKT